MAILEYPLTRPFTLRFFKPVFVLFAVVWITIIVTTSIVAVAYDDAFVYLDTFNSTTTLWYEKILPKSGILPRSSVCQPSTIKIRESLATSGLIPYGLSGFLDNSATSPIDEMIYSDYVLHDCSVQTMKFMQFGADTSSQATVSCNTSADQYLVLTISPDYIMPLNFERLIMKEPSEQANATAQDGLNVTSAIVFLLQIQAQMMGLFDSGILYELTLANNLSSLAVTYSDTNINQTSGNTPANGIWTLLLEYTRLADASHEILPIVFMPNGEVDHDKTGKVVLDQAHQIFEPVLARLSPTYDIWKFINWIYVTGYWIILADLGQVAPTTYTPSANPVFVRDDFTTALRHTPEYNIFVNSTLFELYTSYFMAEIMPPSGLRPPGGAFAPLSDNNVLEPTPTTFKRSYGCYVRRWKSPLVAMFAVLVATYASVQGPYALFIFIAAWLEKRKEEKLYQLHNFAIGHLQSHRDISTRKVFS